VTWPDGEFSVENCPVKQKPKMVVVAVVVAAASREMCKKLLTSVSDWSLFEIPDMKGHKFPDILYCL